MTNLVHIGDLTFDAAADTSDQWVCSNLDGWYSSPPMRADVEERSLADGAFEPEKNFRSARVFTFVGALLGSSIQQAQESLFDSFAAIQADGKPFVLSVENDQGTRSVRVSLSGVAEVTPLSDFTGARVMAQFVAYDPVKYSAAHNLVTGLPTSGGGLEYPLHDPAGALYYGALGDLGRVTVSNVGTAKSFPVVTVTGALSAGFFIQRLDTGQTVRYDRVVPSGTSVTIDFRTGSAVVDGVSDASTYLTRTEFFGAGPGESFDVQFNAIGGSSGSPTMTLTIADGFW